MSKKKPGGVIFLLAAITPLYAAAVGPLTAPYTWQETFQGSELGQFASYPPVQDAGYDPSLYPSSEYGAPGGRALMRVVKPVSAGPLRFGFIRRLDLIAAKDSGFSFSYRLDRSGSGGRIAIGLLGADGKDYIATVPSGADAMWEHANLPISQFASDGRLPLKPGTAVTGIYVRGGFDGRESGHHVPFPY